MLRKLLPAAACYQPPLRSLCAIRTRTRSSALRASKPNVPPPPQVDQAAAPVVSEPSGEPTPAAPRF